LGRQPELLRGTRPNGRVRRWLSIAANGRTVQAALYCAVDGRVAVAQGASVADQASHSPVSAADADPLPEATSLAQGAADAGVGLKLLGGLAVRVICPDLPPRLRAGQDIDFACLSRGRKDVVAYLERSGCVPDRRFNSLNGDRQLYFNAPSGRPIDVMVDRLTMCHTLDFKPSFGDLPLTLPPMDVLLSKLQIVELNEKDVRDALQLLAGVPLGTGGSAGAVLDTGRFSRLVAADWGWWRTVTGNLKKLPGLAEDNPAVLPPAPPHDPLAQAAELLALADSAPKSMKWKLRSNIGDRVRWYELPEEVAH
jgi:hypothetical protein